MQLKGTILGVYRDAQHRYSNDRYLVILSQGDDKAIVLYTPIHQQTQQVVWKDMVGKKVELSCRLVRSDLTIESVKLDIQFGGKKRSAVISVARSTGA